jgi:hypothetical protein
VFVICLVEEDIFSIVTLDRVLFQNSLLVDSVFFDELLPKLHADLVPALTDLQRNDFARHSFCI